MENLTANERIKLMVAIRLNFDLNNSHEDDCKMLISISEKLELSDYFINGLKSDLKC